MPLDRRRFLSLAGAGAVAGLAAPITPARAAAPSGIRAIALDGFTTFDPRPIFALAEQLFPGRGADLGNAWRTRQFEYTWLRTVMGRYADFWQVTEEALVFAASSQKLDLTADRRDQLMQAYLHIRAWPDALPALRAIRAAGIRMAFLSNFNVHMLDSAVANSGLDGLFEPHLSTDRVRAFKPDPRAYRMAIDSFGLAREQIAFAAFGGWDAAGARAFGYPTFWVNRLHVPAEELGVAADASGADLNGLVKFVGVA